MTRRTEEQARELLEELTLCPGIPGFEGPVRSLVTKTLEGLSNTQVSRDGLGSLLFEKSGTSSGPRIALDAHMDEVGFMVQSISENGTIKFVTLGGWWGHVLLAQRVNILTDSGTIPGVIGSKPPHFLSASERNKVQTPESMFVDIGASSRKEAEEWGVQVGDGIVPHCEFIPLKNEKILSAKAFDDRVGVGLLLETMLGLENVDHPNTTVGVAAVQEEVGCRGAVTSSHLSNPDVGIILEGTPADDTPGFPVDGRQAVFGKGPQIRFFDPTAISNRKLVRKVQEVAEANEIPIQIAVRRTGGTDAKSIHIHGRGVPTVVIGVPARYIHTHVSMIHMDDYEAARELLVALVQSLDEATVNALHED